MLTLATDGEAIVRLHASQRPEKARSSDYIASFPLDRRGEFASDPHPFLQAIAFNTKSGY
ncbi:MAG UNVERIFIED_CONTAM: hypothetical protein LVR29_19115 [Microcystis novacekii LVE1205-3]